MPAQRSSPRAPIRAPRAPRVCFRQVAKLTRVRAIRADPSSRTLYFTMPGGSKGRRSATTFVDVENVPEFEGDEAWFEMERVERGNGHMWAWWRAVRQVEAPNDPQ